MPQEAAAAGIEAVGTIYSAKKQASASKYAADLQSKSATEAGRLQDAAAKRSLSHLQHESFLDQVRSNAAARGRYGADVAASQNAYNMAGDLGYNQRAEYLSSGRTGSKVRGQRTNQMNYLRDLMSYGQPQESLDTFVEPDALRRSDLIIPKEQDYGDDPVDTSLDPDTGKPWNSAPEGRYRS
jgi:hypothetical protein